MNRIRLRKSGFRQRGMLLIEVMIAVFLFSIGVLALVGLQASMTRNVTEAKLRGEASFLASELIGQMWLDQANLAKYAISGEGCVDTGYAACTSWHDKVSQILPQGDASVTVDGPRVSIALSWQMAGEMPARFEIDANVTN